MKILEQSIIGKHGLEKCQDSIVFTPDFVAVIDGSTSKSQLSPLPNGKSGGQMAAEIVAEVIQTMPPTTDLRSFVKNTNLLFHGSQSARDKFRGQKGNTPDQPLRSQSSR